MSSRRDKNQTDDSAVSATPSLLRDASIAFEYLVATELDDEPTATVLQKTLSVRSVISTTSSFASRFQYASNLPDHQVLNQIGEGLQGAIFEQVGKALVLKKEHPENESRVSRLSREYDAHTQISLAFQEFESRIGSRVLVPRPTTIISATNDTFWDQHLSRFPCQYQVRTTVVKMERILPLPKVVRKALIAHFYPRNSDQTSLEPNLLQELLSKPQNKHCLARVYLGKVTQVYKQENFSLRNFPLCLDSMQRLGLDIVGLAKSMGRAYAILQWGAGFNGDDIEFVLGTVAKDEDRASNFQQRVVQLWMLDFGQCESVNLDEDPEVVYQRFRGALITGDNQWFIPHCVRDKTLFQQFRTGYVEAGGVILESKGWVHRFDMEDFMDSYEEYAEDFLVPV